MYCIVLYCITLYYIVLYCIALHCIHCITLYIVLHCIVLHCFVLHCIALYCIFRNDTLQWISCFLSNREQSALVDGAQSPYLRVLSAVPQGSVTGPTLFFIYINDLPEYV